VTSSVTDCLNPILVGGTGRSGSTILGRLLGEHPDLLLTNPEEVRFISNDHGLAEALAMKQGSWPRRMRAKREAKLAVERTKGLWYFRNKKTGLHTSMTLEEIDELAAPYFANFGKAPVEATQAFVYGVMAKVTKGLDGRRWVDGTPANARITDLIEPIYPDCQVVAMIRDGRDVAASFVAQKFGPTEIFASLRQWETRMLRMRQAELACVPGRILTIDMLNLVDLDRDGTLQRICDFLNLEITPEFRTWFNENVRLEDANVGRWRTQFDAETVKKIDAVYAEMVERVAASGAQIPLPS
jgi:hypothetical protein